MSWIERRSWALFALFVVGCEARPVRAPLSDYPAANEETGLAPEANNCATRAFPFQVDVSGYLADEVLGGTELSGVASYGFNSVPYNLTAIVLNTCRANDQGLPTIDRTLTLNYYGIARVEPGEYPVSRTAEEDGDFEFSYTDTDPETAIACNDRQEGTVTIDYAGFDRVSGSFDITVRCINEYLLRRIPRETRFVGSFDAQNVGVE